jgi:hypothetical protein
VEVGEGIVLSRGSGLLGEVAFLQHGVASASVRVLPGSSYYRWERHAIDGLLARRPAAHRGLQLCIGRELSRKLAATNHQLVRERSNSCEIRCEAQCELVRVTELARERSARLEGEVSPTGAAPRLSARRATLATSSPRCELRAVDAAVLPRSCV